jgi:hypothetical protein
MAYGDFNNDLLYQLYIYVVPISLPSIKMIIPHSMFMFGIKITIFFINTSISIQQTATSKVYFYVPPSLLR